MRPVRIWSLTVLTLTTLLAACGGGKTDPCKDVTCSNAGYCVPSNGEAQCICNTTYVPKGLECVPATTADVCVNDPCRGLNGKECTAVNGIPQCLCPGDTYEVDGGCLPRGACAPNPCTSANKNTCTDNAGSPVCSCNAGYAPLADAGCDSDRVYDCSKAHDGGVNDDAFEPDECPTLAKSYDISLATPQDHSLNPSQDADWFKLTANGVPVQDGTILSATVTGASVPLYFDVFGPDGLTNYASDHTGIYNGTFRFIANGQDPLFLRIRGTSFSSTGFYTLAISSSGVDDFANTPAGAISITAGGNFQGSVQYAGDLDVVKAQLAPNHTYQFTVGPTTPSNIQIEVLQSDGSTVRKTMSYSTSSNRTHLVHSSGGGEVYLRAKGTNSSATGSFDLAFTDLGSDDHGDIYFDATPISTSTSTAAGNFERAGDTDIFAFTAQAGHAYKFTCSDTVSTYQYSCGMAMYDASGVMVTSQSGGYTTTFSISAKAPTAGTYYFAAYHYTSSTAGGAYSYQLEDVGGDDYADTIAGATGITVGNPVNGTLEVTNDKDVFSFSATANHIYRVDCTSTPSGTCYLNVTDANGSGVAYGYPSQPATWIQSTSATLYVQMGGGGAGTYTITVVDQGVDDHANSATGATALNTGSSVNGDIQYAYDVDVFAVSGNTNTIYTVNCTSTAQYVCRMYVRDPNGSTVTSSSYGTATSVSWKPTTSGQYTVEVTGYSNYTGAYSVSLTTAVDDGSDTFTGATNVTAGATTNAALQWSSDVDFFQFTGTATHIYKVGCTSTSSSACALTVYDPSQASIGSASSGTATEVNFTAATAGTYYVRVSGSAAASYALTITDVGVDDHSNTATGATVITSTGSLNGNIQYVNDVDVFAVNATQNNVYTFTCSNGNANICRLRVYDAQGFSVTSSTVGAATNSVSWKATNAGVYTVQVYGYSSVGATGTYTATLTQTVDDYGDTSASATAVTFGTATSGGIQYAYDVDVFSWTGTSNKIYQVACTGSNSSQCSMTIKDPTGFTVATAYSGTTSSASFKATVSGTFTVSVTASIAGTYSITVTETTDDHGDSIGTATAITASGTAANARIDYGTDIDVFSFQATANHIYQFSCGSSANAYLCQLTLKDSGGATIATATSGSSTAIARTLSTAGTYYVEVTTSYSSYIGQYTYTLQDLGTDDHGDSATAATPLTVGAAPTNGVINIATDHDFFSWTATSGTGYHIRCTTSNSSLCYFTVRNPTGTSVVTGSGSTLSEKGFLASVSGTFTVDVYGYSATGSYTIEVLPDDHADVYTGATAVTLGQNYSGFLEHSADIDFFSAALSANITYTITASGSGWRYVTVYDSTGTAVTTATITSTSTTYRPTTAGTYYFKVSVYSSSYLGAYTFKVQ